MQRYNIIEFKKIFLFFLMFYNFYQALSKSILNKFSTTDINYPHAYPHSRIFAIFL